MNHEPQASSDAASGLSVRRAVLAPWAGLAFLVAALATIPFGIPLTRDYPYVSPLSREYTWLLAGLGALTLALAWRDPLARRRTLTLWPALAILAAWGVAIASSSEPRVSLSRSYGMGLFAFGFVAAQVVTWDQRAFRWLTWAIAAVVIACIADIAAQWAIGKALFTGQARQHPGFHGSQGNPNDAAVIGILMPMCSIALAGPRGMIAYAALVLVASSAWILSASRQVALGWLAGGVVPLLRRVPTKWLGGAIVAVVAVIAIAFAASPQLRGRVQATLDRGLGERAGVYAFGLSKCTERPLTGIGPGMFGNHYVRAVRAGWTWEGRKLIPIGMPWVHSLPIEVMCESGIVGTVAFGATLVALVRRLRRAWRRRVPSRDVLLAIMTALGVMALVGLVDLSFIKDWVRICFWMLLGLGFSQWGVADDRADEAASGAGVPRAQRRRRSKG